MKVSHRSLIYKIDLIYTKARLKGHSSPELALEEKRLTICYILTDLV